MTKLNLTAKELGRQLQELFTETDHTIQVQGGTSLSWTELGSITFSKGSVTLTLSDGQKLVLDDVVCDEFYLCDDHEIAIYKAGAPDICLRAQKLVNAPILNRAALNKCKVPDQV